MGPLARTHRLIVEELPDELLVYDLDKHHAHCLNRVAAELWRSCDGRRSIPELATHLAGTDGREIDEDAVRLAVRDFEAAGLLAEDFDDRSTPVDRRAVLRRLAMAGTGMLPLLISTPVGAQSALASCVDAGQCIPGLTECSPCHSGNKSQCGSKRCRGGNCVGNGHNCDNAPVEVNRARSLRR